MATSNTTNLGALLKELYTLPPVRVLNDKSFLHDKLVKEQASLDFSGRYAYFPVTLQRNLGRGSRGDGGVLPTAGTETVEDAKVYMKRHYYALEWTEAIEVASKNKEGSFENVVTMKMKNVSTDMAKEINRQLYNDSIPGLGVVASGATSATQTLESVQHVFVGDSVEVFSSDGATERTATPISVIAKDRDAKTITLSASVASTTGDVIVLAGNVVAGSPATVYEMEGLRHICGVDRTLHEINSATAGNEEWDGNVIDLEGSVAGESTFELLFDRVGERGRGDIEWYLTTRGIRRLLADEFASQRRYLKEDGTDAKLGYSKIEVNGKECVIDDDAPKGHVFALSPDTLKVLKATDPGFLETEAGDGAVIELKDGSSAGTKEATWQAWYRYHLTLSCNDPGRNGMAINAEDE